MKEKQSSHEKFQEPVSINETGSHPDPSAMLDVSSNSKGLLVPSMTSKNRTEIPNPKNGLLVYDTDTNTFWWFKVDKWEELNLGATKSLKDHWDPDGYQIWYPTLIDRNPDKMEGSAMLEVASKSLGILIPRMSSNERNHIIKPAEGLLVYDTDTHSFWWHKEGAWAEIAKNSDFQGWSLTGNKGTQAGKNFIGTTDDQPLMFRVNDKESFYIEDDSFGGITAGGNTIIRNKVKEVSYGFSDNILIGEGILEKQDVEKSVNVTGNILIGSETLDHVTLANYSGHSLVIGSFNAPSYETNLYCSALIGSFLVLNAPSNDYSFSIALGHIAMLTGSKMVRIGSLTNFYVNSIGGVRSWTTLSGDTRFSEVVEEKSIPGLEFITQLNPVSYRHKHREFMDFLGMTEEQMKEHDPDFNPDNDTEVHTGFIAQEVEETAKNMGYDFNGIDGPQNENDYYGIRYGSFVAPLVKAVQELEELVTQQKEMIENLTTRIQKLEGA